MTIGEKIKKAREAEGITQDDLAKAVGCCRLQITKLERDIEWPSIFLLQQIAQTLGMRKVENALLEILS